MDKVILTSFYFLWLFPISGWIAWLEFDFLLRFTNKNERRLVPVFIVGCCVLAFLNFRGHFSFLESLLAETLLWAGFAGFLLKAKWRDAVGPVVLLFTLSTFMEGSTAVLMRCLVKLDIGQPVGQGLQLMLSVALAAFFFLWIPRRILRTRSFSACPAFFSYLYILLLPCAFLVLSVRNSLGLDGPNLEKAPSSLGDHPALFSLFILLGAIVTFFILLNVFCKVTDLSEQEAEKTLLLDRLRNQRLYIDEARKRNEKYRGFQHDIDNHLLVLSGLLKEGEYDRALCYSEKIHSSASTLLSDISTGNTVLDVLLKEKIDYAKQCKIKVTFDICLSEKLPIDDMDLCIIFSNALDNAITACQTSGQSQPELSILAQLRHHFLLIEIVNTTKPSYDFHYGTGLNNIRRTVEKYQGTLEIQNAEGKFRLSVLLCLTGSLTSNGLAAPTA